jgi:hypothetical protein
MCLAVSKFNSARLGSLNPLSPTFPSCTSQSVVAVAVRSNDVHIGMSATHAPAQELRSDGERGEVVGEVYLPRTYILRQSHVEDALSRARFDADGSLTLWIHHTTMGIEAARTAADRSVVLSQGVLSGVADLLLLSEAKKILRILVRVVKPMHDVPPVRAAVLAKLIEKLSAYEPDIVDIIRGYATHNRNEMHRLGDNAFINGKHLTEVVLPHNITHIGMLAFCRCTSLTSVTLPEALEHIDERAFSGCRNLKEITLPNSLTYISDGAFNGCASLRVVTLPNSLTYIGSYAFNECCALAAVALPDSLIHLGDYAFCRCTALAAAILPGSLTRIGNGAFRGCTALAALTMPPMSHFVDMDAFIGYDIFSECPLPR